MMLGIGRNTLCRSICIPVDRRRNRLISLFIPRPFAENHFKVLTKYNFLLQQLAGKPVQLFPVLHQEILGTFVRKIYQLLHLFVDYFGCLFAIRFVEVEILSSG